MRNNNDIEIEEKCKNIAKIVNSINQPFSKTDMVNAAKFNNIHNYTHLPIYVCGLEEVIEDGVKLTNGREIKMYRIVNPIYYKKFLDFWTFLRQKRKNVVENKKKSSDDTEADSRSIEKAIKKMHDTRTSNVYSFPGGGKYRIEFNRQRQLFHFDDGAHEENTNGWCTVMHEGDVSDWSFFIEMKEFLVGKEFFNSVDDIKEQFLMFMKAIRQFHSEEKPKLSMDICVEYLKQNGYSGKIEKIVKSTYEI